MATGLKQFDTSGCVDGGVQKYRLIGKTGMGKSTLGNILLGLSPDGLIKQDENHAIEICQQDGLFDESVDHFPVSDKPESCTNNLRALAVNQTNLKLRVIDVPGFADSVRRPDATVLLTNMQFVRHLVRANDAFKFDYVLYFLPFREPPERVDGNLREELEVLYF